WGRTRVRLVCTARSATSPAGGTGEVRRGRGRLLRNHKGGRFPAPNGLPFGVRAPAIFHPARLSPACSPGWSLRQRNGRLEPPARAPLLTPCRRPTSGPPGSRAISLSFQALDRLHVGDGWRHPRPVGGGEGYSRGRGKFCDKICGAKTCT